MIGPLLGIVGFAVLFAVFGFAARRERCGGDCGHCHGSCEWAEKGEGVGEPLDAGHGTNGNTAGLFTRPAARRP